MRILGIDPGLRRTGFGVIDADGPRLRYVASGTIVVPSDISLSARLKTILDHIREVAQAHQPDIAAMEQVFLNTNPMSTLLLGQARGAAMCGLADSGLEVHEYTALQIKKSVVGTGCCRSTACPLPTLPTPWPAPSATPIRGPWPPHWPTATLLWQACVAHATAVW